MTGHHGSSLPRGLLPLLLFCYACQTQAGLNLPTFRDEPVEASTFYGLVLSILPTVSTVRPDEGSEISGDVSDESSATSSSDRRRLLQAREDAALFVASAGEYRGAHLEAALNWLRQRPTSAGLDDLQLAAAILQMALHDAEGHR